ncbi:phosphatidate cytidylyltransferase [Thalassovita sp.]|uniref:phosphatidate cytidylyltransferase n=1 Tax=Thalassovita sp. TaxID=1979401 RepID=UPI002881158A|nr:phosphatidate cytidylyltransferase [Thalassovita sp.]MDF1801377.1 phosphatidate cytidylyltransferase [Thalassovita sp.]
MAANWDDLAPRVVSAIGMLAVGAFAIWQGGLVFTALLAVVCGLMIWELVRMLQPDASAAAVQLGGLGAGAVLLAAFLPPVFSLPVLVAPAIVGLSFVTQNRGLYAVYTPLILLSGLGAITLRLDYGVTWTLWLVAVVIVTDVAGYFAGRIIGGPKFWPRVSPKKTWSGTIAGWLGAALVAVAFMANTGAGASLIWISMILSFASQMGDAAESAIKRKTGVKDSSNLIPGHGGLLDRFDAMLGALLLFLLAEMAGFYPGLQ